jgi:gamma-glutamylcyclotransferase (GGCT)/AIG2-like uncharacterized protein YtfP
MYFFAYGSSMNFEHMRRICGWHFTVEGVATLADFEFGLDLRGYSAINPKLGSKVFGVLYNIDQYCIDVMDEYEGYPNVFNRMEVDVKDSDGHNRKAWVYLEKPSEFGGKAIKKDHWHIIISGAEANHLPKEWIDYLKSLTKYPEI